MGAIAFERNLEGVMSSKAQHASRFVSAGGSGAVASELFHSETNKLCVAFSELAAGDANIVLKSRADAVRVSSQCPFHDFRLISPDASSGPCRFRELAS